MILGGEESCRQLFLLLTTPGAFSSMLQCFHLPGEVETTIMVVGAGRGPLVRGSLAAAAAAGCRVKVYAVEKNPNAVVTYVYALSYEIVLSQHSGLVFRHDVCLPVLG